MFKTVKTTRTHKLKIVVTPKLEKDFADIQHSQRLYYNYGLKYLEQHYGVNHLNVWFPSTSIKKQYLVSDMKRFAREQMLKNKGINLKDMHGNVQSVDKCLEQLIISFDKYRKGQYRRINYWSKKDTEKYLKTHRTTLSGFMRLSFKHSDDEIKSIALKRNKARFRLNNNYNINLPYFGNIQTKKSLAFLKGKDIIESRIVKRGSGIYELQVITKFNKDKNITKEQINNIVGLDVNLAQDKFFTLSNGRVISWDDNTKERFNILDKKLRKLQEEINKHGTDNSVYSRKLINSRQKIHVKASNIINNWQRVIAKELSTNYPVLSMEMLNSFEIRLSKRYNKFLRKNTNKKLATLQPTTFRKYMENRYENDGHILYEVNSIDTSKTCNNCNYINHALKVGVKKWKCPQCSQELDRDLNAAYNIRDWIDVSKHAVKQQPERFKYLKDSDLVQQF